MQEIDKAIGELPASKKPLSKVTGAQEAYENVKQVFKKSGKSSDTNNILEDLLSEKSYDIHKLVSFEEPKDDIDEIQNTAFKKA